MEFISEFCHRLQLASFQEAASVKEIKMFFGTMTSVWKLFYYSPQNAEALKGIQAIGCSWFSRAEDREA